MYGDLKNQYSKLFFNINHFSQISEKYKYNIISMTFFFYFAKIELQIIYYYIDVLELYTKKICTP